MDGITEIAVHSCVHVNEDGYKCVALYMTGTPLTELDGEIVPGLGMTPEAARALASDLMRHADEVDGQ